MRKPSWKFHSKIVTGFKFEKTTFSKKALKTNKFWKIWKNFLHFCLHFQWTFKWYIVCFHTPNGFSYTLTLLPSHLKWPPLYVTKKGCIHFSLTDNENKQKVMTKSLRKVWALSKIVLGEKTSWQTPWSLSDLICFNSAN